jgi:hypothetical protein
MIIEPLFAAKGGWEQAIIPIVFLVVWAIGAAAKWFGQQQQQQQIPPLAKRPGNRGLQRASDQELEEFVRQYVGDKPNQPAPPKQKQVVRPKVGNTQPRERPANRPVESRHLHSNLEDRSRAVVHSKLEDSHISAHAGQMQLTAMGAEGQVASRKAFANRFIGTMLARGNIARAMVLGQVLQRPAGLEGETSGPLAPPSGMRI